MMMFGLLCAAAAGAAEKTRYWFFLTDKGPQTLQKQILAETESRLSERVLARRARMPGGGAVDETDLPVFAPYLDELQGLGLRIGTVSRWLNAVSARAGAEQISAAQQLPFVRDIRPVLCFNQPQPEQGALIPDVMKKMAIGPVDYGSSFTQNDQIQAPSLHQLGYFGQGVRIAVFDTGFRLNHEAFDSLHVIRQYDFINDDDVTDLEPEDHPDQISHGTMVLSTLAGYAPGKLIGPAYRAEFLLAKTEIVNQEIQVEEDYWIAAAEWADTLGADLISSSLGYLDWYTYQDMDGETAPITIAADLAVQKGMAVFVSAGNEYTSKWRYILAPADGKWVMAVGAVDARGQIASFSSRGPTADGRIKPDVCAMGVAVTTVVVPADNEAGANYRTFSGTSAACPLAAGAAALVLNAYPDLNPMELRQALQATATKAQQPDTVYGYGLEQVFSAYDYLQNPPIPTTTSLIQSVYSNPYRISNSPLYLVLNLQEDVPVKVKLFNILGQDLGTLWQGTVARGGYRQIALNNWHELPRPLSSGPYLLQVETGGKRERRMITLLR